MSSEPDITGSRLGRVVLSHLAMTIVVITLAPFRFERHAVNPLSYEWRSLDAVLNVVMFVPIGFIYQLSRRRGRRTGWRGAIAIGALLSMAVESAQFFAPGRFPSVVDLAANSGGAGLGAWLAVLAFGQMDGAKTIRALAVELPLMGLAYLLVPLAWLVAVSSQGSPRAWCVVPLTVSAGWIIGAVFSSFERAPLQRILLATSAWMIIALSLEATASLRRVAVAAAIGLAASLMRAVAPTLFTHEAQRPGTARRFEAATLRVVLPLLCAYLVLSSLTPLAEPRSTWMGIVELFPSGRVPTNSAIFRALEHISAFTLIGYALAEYAGRVRDTFRKVFPLVFVFACVASAALEIARGWHPNYGASASMFILTLLGAALGGWLYVLQLAHVRALTFRGGWDGGLANPASSQAAPP